MALSLFAHPFSSYCQKALVALYENGTPFTYRLLDQRDIGTLDQPVPGAPAAGAPA